MSTGVTAADNLPAEFEEFKNNKNTSVFKIYKIENGVIVTESTSESKAFEDFTNALPSDDCRYALYKNDFQTTDGRPNTKLVIVFWSPDSASVKPKMIYAGSKTAFDQVCTGVSIKITATDMSELTKSILDEACRKFN